MEPTIISTQETTTLNPAKQVVKAVAVKWQIGQHGPFTYTTTWEDIQSGAAKRAIAQQAQALQQQFGVTS